MVKSSSPWVVPRMWEGDTACVLASGPSMSQAVAETVRRSTLRTIAVNNTWELAPWADMLYGADVEWWQKYHAATEKFGGLKVSCTKVPFEDVLQLNNTGVVGFDKDPANIRTGGNSGYQAVHIAIHAGCSKILLCGFDMQGGHWHGDHPAPLRETPDGTFIRWCKRFGELAREVKGVEIINCTPHSALTCFPMADLKDTIEACCVFAQASDPVSA